ncbi:MAG: 5-(carboxyamino)imidazole ribonucleotide mutase [Proteobacteria bacterium]|nr:5-(carboxyamino)imidazole ribonucleotide mutase [Pseudomonadota bacterium]
MKKVALVMGSKSDWVTMKNCAELLDLLGIAYHQQIVSAHRTPKMLYEFARNAEANGYEIIIAAAGGAAHLPGMIAAITPLPVIGVPIKSSVLNGIDSLLSIVQMPSGVPVATMSIGTAGAKNAALYCAAILATHDVEIKKSLHEFRQAQTQMVVNNPNPDE